MKNFFLQKLVVFLFCMVPFFVQAADNIHTIAVNGVAENIVDPNMMIVQIDSWGKASTAKAAQEKQAAQYKRVLGVIEKYKIKEEDYKTENFSVQPEYVYDSKAQKSKITGFVANHYVQITFKKISEAGTLVDELVSAGKSETQSGVSVQNISWDTDKRGSYENAAIAEAVRGARARADELAKAAGVKIKAVHRIVHTSYTAEPQAFSAMAKSRESMMSDKGGGTDLSAGKIKIRVDVQMEFEI